MMAGVLAGTVADDAFQATWQFQSAAVCSHNWYREPFREHTVQDDMESMLYVVLYCGILYLPHHTSDEEMRVTLKMIFDYYDEEPGAEFPNGGMHKATNFTSRKFTNVFDWHSAEFRVWLDSVMDFCQRQGTVWAPQPLLEWWDKFLEQHQHLPSQDWRNNVTLRRLYDLKQEAPQHVSGEPWQSTRTSPASLPLTLKPGGSALKRSHEDEDEGEDDRPQSQLSDPDETAHRDKRRHIKPPGPPTPLDFEHITRLLGSTSKWRDGGGIVASTSGLTGSYYDDLSSGGTVTEGGYAPSSASGNYLSTHFLNMYNVEEAQ